MLSSQHEKWGQIEIHVCDLLLHLKRPLCAQLCVWVQQAGACLSGTCSAARVLNVTLQANDLAECRSRDLLVDVSAPPPRQNTPGDV